MIEFVLQLLLATVVLFVLSGLTQALPIGLGSVKQVSQKHGAAALGKKVTDVRDAPIVTPTFDDVVTGEVTTLTTDRSFSWIVAKPLGYYNPARYLLKEALTQLLIALGLVIVLRLTAPLGDGPQLALVGLAALLALIATYGQLANWWGLTWRYVLGAAGVLIASWVLAALAIQVIW
jgi:ABC-type uncharacterized transport system permease subunit